MYGQSSDDCEFLTERRRPAFAGGVLISVEARQGCLALVNLGKTDAGRFCWLDLAATDAEKAKAF